MERRYTISWDDRDYPRIVIAARLSDRAGTFSEARKALDEHYAQIIEDARNARARLRDLRSADITETEDDDEPVYPG